MRKLVALATILLAIATFSAGPALAASHAAAAPRTAANTFASCRAQGGFAVCIASGTVHRPLVIRVHVTSSRVQKVSVSWNMVCVKGSGAGSSMGHFRATVPVNRIIRHPYRRPGSCTVAASGQLARGGHIHVWLTATHWRP